MPRYIKYKRNRVRHGLKHDRYMATRKVTTVGALQYADSGATPLVWASAIGAADLRVGVPVDYFVQVDPANVVPADNSTYQYRFELIPDPTGVGSPNTAGIAGLTLTWQGNLARIQGTVPADQVGKKVTIRATVTDMGANVVAGTNLVGTWTA